MCPGTRVAKATSPTAPHARYSVMNRLPPPATRFSAPKNPPPPIICVCVVIWIELDIHDSSPASEITVSFGCNRNSSTGIVVPTMRLCITRSSAFRLLRGSIHLEPVNTSQAAPSLRVAAQIRPYFVVVLVLGTTKPCGLRLVLDGFSLATPS